MSGYRDSHIRASARRPIARKVALALLIATGWPIHARTPNDDPSASLSDKSNEQDLIIVTGSRIVRSELEVPTVVTSVDANDIDRAGATNLTTFLMRIPALVGSVDNGSEAGANAGFGEAGMNFLNLRNLGPNRTLVLVDGRRHVSSSILTSGVDMTSIPTDLVERIDVMTGGASAIYGADGVAGVVNIILKHDFDGIALHGQTGISQYGDGASHMISATAGQNFGAGRGNVAVALEYSRDERVAHDQRRRLDPDRYAVLVPNDKDGPGTPHNVFATNVRLQDTAPGGALDVNFDGIPDFTGSGRPYERGILIPNSGGLTEGGSSTPVSDYLGDILPSAKRMAANLLVHYNFSDAFRLSLDAKFAQERTLTFASPTSDFGTFIASDNPFIPPGLAGLTNNGLQLNRDNIDFGLTGQNDLRRTYRAVIAASGRVGDHADYQLYYEYGLNRTRFTNLNERFADRYFAALDVVGDPVTGVPLCRSSIDPAAAADAVTFTPGPNSGCRPLNLFGVGAPDPSALAFVLTNPVSHNRFTQQVLSGTMTGNLGHLLALPGGAIQYSVGGEWRRETAAGVPSQTLSDGLTVDRSALPPIRGKFHVAELFGELNLPILADRPLAQVLSLGGALRWSDYSTVGRSVTWQLNGIYAPVREISFRGSVSKAVRAPDTLELFLPTITRHQVIADPCDVSESRNGSQFRAKNCAALLSSLGVDPASFNPRNSPAAGLPVLGTSSGNRDLKAEIARTWTAGVVLRPHIFQSFSMSLDWYDIRLRNAINKPDAQRLAELCVDGPSLVNSFCPLIQRDPNGTISGFAIRSENVALFRASGADLNVRWRTVFGRSGVIGLNLLGGYTQRLTFIATPGDNPIDEANTMAAPRWQINANAVWSKGAFTLNYNYQWYFKTRRFDNSITAADPDYVSPKDLFFKSFQQHDVQLELGVGVDWKLYGGVNNLFNAKPSADQTNYPISGLGRFFYVGLKWKAARHGL